MKAIVNQHFRFDRVSLKDLSFEQISATEYNCFYKGTKYRIEWTSLYERDKSFEMFVNGYSFTVELEDELDEVVSKIRQITKKDTGGNKVNAPIPGVIKEIFVSEGEYLKKDVPVLLLEAMKMENVISTPEKGTVHKIGVKEGDNVKKGSLLFVIDR